MLFGPEDGRQFGDPQVDGSQAVEAGVAGGADSDQQIRIADAGIPVMNMEHRIPCPTAPALIPVALQNDFPVSTENNPRSAGASGNTSSTSRRRRGFARRRHKRAASAGNGALPGPAGRIWRAGEG
jgi:hypothetical protein